MKGKEKRKEKAPKKVMEVPRAMPSKSIPAGFAKGASRGR